MSNVVRGHTRKLTLSPGGPIGPGGPGNPGVPYTKGNKQENTVMNFLCEERNLCPFPGRKVRGLWEGTETQYRAQSQPESETLAQSTSPDLTAQPQSEASEQATEWKMARLLLCGLTLVHLLRHYKGNFAKNTWRVKKRQGEEQLTVRPGSPGSPASPFIPWRPWSKQWENRSQHFTEIKWKGKTWVIPEISITS